MRFVVARVIGLAVSATILVLSSGSIASAQSKCDAGKLKEYGKKIFCLAKVDAKAAKKGQPIDTAKETKCFTKFTAKCAKAEGRGDCTSAIKSCAALMAEADTCRAAADVPVIQCNPVSQTGCSPGEGCYVASGAEQCLPEGTIPLGGSCAVVGDCAGGSQCVSISSVLQCRELCSVAPSSCPGIEVCVSLNEPAVPNVGVCL